MLNRENVAKEIFRKMLEINTDIVNMFNEEDRYIVYNYMYPNTCGLNDNIDICIQKLLIYWKKWP